MLNTARTAAMSEPDRNAWFARRWTGPPPRERKSPGHHTGSPFGNLNSTSDHTAFEQAGARSVNPAVRRLAKIERRATPMNTIGLLDASLPLGANAAPIWA